MEQQIQKELNVINKTFVFIFLLILFSSCSSAQKLITIKEKEQLSYELLNFHYSEQVSENKKYKDINQILFYKTVNPKKRNDSFKDVSQNDFYEKISDLDDFRPEVREEMRKLFTKKEKEYINHEMSSLNNEVILDKEKLRKNLLCFGREIKFKEIITFPIHIKSKGKVFSFFIVEHVGNSSNVVVYKKEKGKWQLLYSLMLSIID